MIHGLLACSINGPPLPNLNLNRICSRVTCNVCRLLCLFIHISPIVSPFDHDSFLFHPVISLYQSYFTIFWSKFSISSHCTAPYFSLFHCSKHWIPASFHSILGLIHHMLLPYSLISLYFSLFHLFSGYFLLFLDISYL